MPIYSTDHEAIPSLVDDQTMIVILIVAAAVVLAVFVFGMISSYGKFKRELHHVNMRIEQSRSERERHHYIRRRRRLWVSFLLPFIKYSK